MVVQLPDGFFIHVFLLCVGGACLENQKEENWVVSGWCYQSSESSKCIFL
jgi:hypothetical protein